MSEVTLTTAGMLARIYPETELPRRVLSAMAAENPNRGGRYGAENVRSAARVIAMRAEDAAAPWYVR